MYTIHSHGLQLNFQDFRVIPKCEGLSFSSSLPGLYSSLVEVLSEFEQTELAAHGQQIFNESLCMLKKIIVVGLNKTVSSSRIAATITISLSLSLSLSRLEIIATVGVTMTVA